MSLNCSLVPSCTFSEHIDAVGLRAQTLTCTLSPLRGLDVSVAARTGDEQQHRDRHGGCRDAEANCPAEAA